MSDFQKKLLAKLWLTLCSIAGFAMVLTVWGWTGVAVMVEVAVSLVIFLITRWAMDTL